MKAYTYKPQECGFEEWPSGLLRLEGSIPVDNPADADVFIVPASMSAFRDDIGRIDRLPYMAGNESRHVLFDVSDHFTKSLNRDWIMIRCDVRSWMTDPNAICFPWPAGNNLLGQFEDFIDCMPLPEGGFSYDVSCHHWMSSQARIQAANSCLQDGSLKCDIEQYSDFTGYLLSKDRPEFDPVEGDRRWKAYRSSLQRSRIALCGESIPGVFPYRFWEALMAGRVPLLVGSDFVFPFADEIPYKEFIMQLPLEHASEAADAVRDMVSVLSDEEFLELGRKGRHYWELYLDSRKWPSLMTAAVEKKLLQMGVACA